MEIKKDKVKDFINDENWKEKRLEELLYLDNEAFILRYNQVFGRFQLFVGKIKKSG